jgi:2-dehydro-3-deoxyglucarate aldolase/4-hydroxy-2-oxoheptanedioate aldolase
MNLFKKKLQEGKPLFGTIITLGQAAVAEMLSNCAFDWLWIDMEHAPLSLEKVQQLLQAKSDRCSALVRIPANDDVWIKRVLDLGADGIIVPQVKTGEEAERAVSAAKYPPIGIRSVGIARAHGFGMDFTNHVQEANNQIAVILQVEHKTAVQNIESIIAVPGVDAIVIGPYDLSGSLGKLGQIQDAEVQQAIESVRCACRRAKIPIGIFALNPDQAATYVAREYQLLAVGIDVHYLWSSAKAGLDVMRR